jgi:hypothetical protein
MVTRLSRSMTRTDEGWVAECHELSIASTGRSAADAIAALRIAIEQQVRGWYVLEADALPASVVPMVRTNHSQATSTFANDQESTRSG